MKQFEFEVPVVIYATRTVYINAETSEEALEMLRDGDGDYDNTNETDEEVDLENATLVDVTDVEDDE